MSVLFSERSSVDSSRRGAVLAEFVFLESGKGPSMDIASLCETFITSTTQEGCKRLGPKYPKIAAEICASGLRLGVMLHDDGSALPRTSPLPRLTCKLLPVAAKSLLGLGCVPSDLVAYARR